MDQVLIMQNIIIIFLVLLGVFMIIYRLGKHPPRKKDQKIFACGEDIPPEHLNIPHESFYRIFMKSTRVEWLRRMHSGNLSDYLLWILIGLIFMVMMISILW